MAVQRRGEEAARLGVDVVVDVARGARHRAVVRLGPEVLELDGEAGRAELEMEEAAEDLRFEYAARLRDEIKELRRDLRDANR